MINGGRCVRAFRPSRFSANDECDQEAGKAKAMNLELYAARVEAGLPLFDGDEVRAVSLQAKATGT